MRAAVSDGEHHPHVRGAAAWLRLVASFLVNIVTLTLWLVLLAWLIGRVLTDRFAWSQFLWWIPTPAVLIAAALGLLLAFRTARTPQRRRRRVIAWATCAVILSAYLPMFEHRLLHRAPPLPAPEASLRLAHWNMTLDNHSDVPGLMAAIETLDADLLVLTIPPGEVRRQLHERAVKSEGLLHIIDGWPMLMVSRLPIVDWRIVIATEAMYITQVDLDASATLGRTITVFLVDLPSSPRQPRMAMAHKARELLDRFKAATPDICIGDFNITRDSASIDALFPGMQDAFNVAGHGWGASFPRRLPLYHIDHVLVNDTTGLRAARYDIIDEGHSRHRTQKAWIANDSSRLK